MELRPIQTIRDKLLHHTWIHLTSTEVYTTTWVGFLEEFSHPYACTMSAVQIDIQRTMEQQDYAKKLLDVSIDQVFLTVTNGSEWGVARLGNTKAGTKVLVYM